MAMEPKPESPAHGSVAVCDNQHFMQYSTKIVSKADGVKFIRIEDGCVVFAMVSGR